MIYIVQYQTERCKNWVWGNTRITADLASKKARDWEKLLCVTDTRILEIDLQTTLLTIF